MRGQQVLWPGNARMVIGRGWVGRDALGVEHLAAEPERLDAGRDAGVDRDLDQRVAQLVERGAVADRALEVGLELVRRG